MRKYCLLFLLLCVLSVTARTPLTLLHTNDTHSQLEPYPAGDGYDAGKAGVLRRETLIRQIRSETDHVLVLDAGDFVQGSAYFNLFKGDAEMALMNFLKLDAVTLGNHEFDNGVDSLVKMLRKANFPVVCTNYDVSKTELRNVIKPWLIVNRGKIRIGIVGADVNPKGLVTPSNFEGVVYLDPISTLETRAAWLKKKKNCDIVICLSHLGFENDNGRPDDLTLAEKSRNIDVIIGGHTHTYLKTPVLRMNLNGDSVIINQVGKGGSYIGRIDLEVEKRNFFKRLFKL